MQHRPNINLFFGAEEKLYLKVRGWRDALLKPVCVFLAHKKVTSNMVSYAGLLMVVLFVYFFTFNPWFSFIFLLLNLFFDSVDGSLARFLQQDSMKGSVMDTACDHLSFFIIFLTFLYFQLFSQFLGAVYILSYAIFIFFIILLKALRVEFFPVIRSKYYIYIIFFIWLVSGVNFFTPMILFFSIYMIISNLFLFHKLRCSLL